MRRRKLLVVLTGLAVVVAVGVFVPGPSPEPSLVTRENFDRIKGAMSRADVEAMLGPPGDYRTGPEDVAASDGLWEEKIDLGDDPIAAEREWRGDTCTIRVRFNASGTVVGKVSFGSVRADQGVLTNLLWRAMRQSRRWFWFP
jgi:hypothetical protein